MDEKAQEEAKGKAVEEAKAKEKTPGADDAKDRDSPEGKAEEKAPSLIDNAMLAAGELRKENDRKEELLKREEELEANRIMAGRSSGAGVQEPAKETDEGYVERFQKGEVNPLEEG